MGAEQNLQDAREVISAIDTINKYFDVLKEKDLLKNEIDKFSNGLKNNNFDELYTVNRENAKNKAMRRSNLVWRSLAIITFLVGLLCIVAIGITYIMQLSDIIKNIEPSITSVMDSVSAFETINVTYVLIFLLIFGVITAILSIISLNNVDEFNFFHKLCIGLGIFYILAVIGVWINSGDFLNLFLDTVEAQTIGTEFCDIYIKYAICVTAMLGWTILCIILFGFILSDYRIYSIINNKLQKEARYYDYDYISKHFEELKENFISYLNEQENKLEKLEKRYGYNKFLEAKSIIQKKSIIYCTAFDERGYVSLYELNILKEKIIDCIDVIKSGRATSISEALNVIENDIAMDKLYQEQRRANDIEEEKLRTLKESEKLAQEHRARIEQNNINLKRELTDAKYKLEELQRDLERELNNKK